MSRAAQIFNTDVKHHQGYRYTSGELVSSRLANRRLTQLTLEILRPFFSAARQEGNRGQIVDVGCGDGVYTAALARALPHVPLLGFDLAHQAVELARRRFPPSQYPKLTFLVADILRRTTLPRGQFEAAVVRGVIHHLPQPSLGVANTLSLAKRCVFIEPNGHNPFLKIIETFSPYHRVHRERSYSTPDLVRWMESAGGKVESVRYVGLVPFFCPSWLALLLKKLEPLVERDRLAKYLCAQQVLIVRV